MQDAGVTAIELTNVGDDLFTLCSYLRLLGTFDCCLHLTYSIRPTTSSFVDA